jgi:hypothetical protein
MKTTNEACTEYNHEEFMRAAAVARIAVQLARGTTAGPEAFLGEAWDLVDNAIELRREVLASGITLK